MNDNQTHSYYKLTMEGCPTLSGGDDGGVQENILEAGSWVEYIKLRGSYPG